MARTMEGANTGIYWLTRDEYVPLGYSELRVDATQRPPNGNPLASLSPERIVE